MEPQLIQFKKRFVEEAAMLIEDMERDLMLLETHPDARELIESAFRCMHTLKGTSSMYGFNHIAEITHELENIYDLVRYNELSVSSSTIDITLTSADFIRRLLKNDDLIDAKEAGTYQNILASIHQILEGGKEKRSAPSVRKRRVQTVKDAGTWQISFTPQESIIKRCINLLLTFRDLFALGSYQIVQNKVIEGEDVFNIFLYTDKSLADIEDALIFVMDYCKIVKIADFNIFDEEALDNYIMDSNMPLIGPSIAELNNPMQPDTFFEHEVAINNVSVTNAIVKSRIAVEAVKLDELMYLVSELITTNSQLAILSSNPAYRPISPIFERIDKLSKQFRNNTLSLRLVPINEMTVRFQRLVRDLSVKLGKEVNLVTQGTETELDKNTIDTLADPLMHLIRNCIDHGIELPEVRESKGKPRKGEVKISAYHSGSFIFIEISDDGKGIDTEFVRDKAVKNGFITENTALTQDDIFELIFKPGFSTAESLTDVSGRGVGLDVVKKTITDLRGQIEVSSNIGLGATFTIKLQQTIAILDTMLFRIGQMHFLVPVSDVEECSLIPKSEIEQRRYLKTISHAGSLIPYVDLYDLFGLTSEAKQSKLRIIIINHQGLRFAIATDTIVGEHQAVLKSLGRAVKDQPYISLASMLGDGNLAYLIDLNTIQNLLINKKLIV